MFICVLTNLLDDFDDPIDPSPYMNGYHWKHHPVQPVNVEKQIKELINEGVDIFINLYDGSMEDPFSGIDLVRLLEKHNAAFTGADSRFYDPSREEMKNAARNTSVPTPNWIFINRVDDADKAVNRLKFPMLVKPPHGYASVGIYRESRVETVEQLRAQVESGIKKFGRVLIEEFIEGREFTCLITKNPDNPKRPITFIPVEFIFPPGETFKHYDMKWVEYKKMSVRVVRDARIDTILRVQATRIFTELGGNGYARCDYRMDAGGVIYMLEINPNCGIFYPPHEPGSADFSLLNDPVMDHAKFMKYIIRNAQLRQTHIAAEKIITVQGNQYRS